MHYEPGVLEPHYDPMGASDGMVQLAPTFSPYKELNTAVFTRWPGPDSTLERQWSPNLGAHAGLRSTGAKNDWSGFWSYPLPPLYIPRPGQKISVNAQSQQFYGASTNTGVPGVFVPTSPVNNNGPATQ